MSGGGEVKLSRLDDVQSSTAKVDGQFLKYDASQKKWVGGAVDLNSIVGAAPGTLDTLVELAAAINNDDDFATTIADSIATKVSQTDLDTHTTNTNNPHAVTATQVGLGNVDNTSDTNKPVSTAQQTALNSKAPTANPSFTGTINSSGLIDFGDRTSNDVLIRAETDSNDLTLIRAASFVDGYGVSLKYIGSGSGDENIFELTTDGGGSLKIDNSGDVGINTAPVDGVDLAVGTFTSSGNVGIGTDSPDNKLTVDGDVDVTGFLSVGDTSNTFLTEFGSREAKLYVDGGDDYTIFVNRSNDVANSSGFLAYGRERVGGVAVQDGDSLGRNIAFAWDGDEFLSTAQMDFVVDGTVSDGSAPTAITFSTGSKNADREERLRIDSSGNVGIGTSSPSAKLDVSGDANIDGTLTVDKISLSDNSFIVETGDFTLSGSHKGATILLQNTAAITITVPALSTGHTTSFIAETANTVAFQAGAGLSGLNSFNGANSMLGQFAQAQIIFKTAEYAFLGGQIT
jgi:hypothetical protein